MAYNYSDQLDSLAKGLYNEKLLLINCDECPYKLPADVWQDNLGSWPDLQFGDVYSHLVESPGEFTRASMKSYKSLEAHEYFMSGCVRNVLSYTPPSSAYMLLRADVQSYERVNEEPHCLWIAVSQDGSVATSHCNCMAGLSEACSHIAALLFKIEAAVRLGYTKKTCTELPCQWNADFIDEVKPAPIKDILFYQKSCVKKAKKRKAKTQFTKSTEEEQQALLKSLYACESKPVVLSTFRQYADKFYQS